MERTVYRSGGKRWLLIWRVDTMRGWKCQITRKCNSLKSWITSKAESLTIRDGYYASLLDKREIKYQFRRIKSLLHRFSWPLNSNCTRSLPLVTFNACSLASSLLAYLKKSSLHSKKKRCFSFPSFSISLFLCPPFRFHFINKKHGYCRCISVEFVTFNKRIGSWWKNLHPTKKVAGSLSH